MHDVIALERRGLPAIALLSDAFRPQALFQAAALRLSDASRLFVAHPISDASETQLEAKADAIYEELLLALTREQTLSNDSGSADASALSASPLPASEGERCSSGGTAC
jgi:hypothetical protein